MNHSTIARTVTRGIRLSTVAALLALLTGLLAVTQPVRAGTNVVTNNNGGGAGSLRQAITDANNHPGADIITFAAATNGTPIVLGGPAGEDANASGDLDILDGGDLSIQGNGAANTIIDGGGGDRVFQVCPAGGCANTVTLDGVTIRQGNGIFSASPGGGICNRDSTLNLQNSSVSENAAAIGGGICNSGGAVTVDSTIVSAKLATAGGGRYN